MELAYTVDYRGQPLNFYRIDQGLAYLCPENCCRAYHWIDLASGTMHKITSAPGAPLSIVASLGCPCQKKTGCSFHVVVTDGVAR